MSNLRDFSISTFILATSFASHSMANDDAYSARELASYTRSGSLSIVYGDGSAGGEPLEKLKQSFKNNSSDLSGFIDASFQKGAERVLSRYEKSGRKISVPESEKLSNLDFFMADFFTRGSKSLKNSEREIEYVIHRSEAYDSKLKENLSSKNFEAIYGEPVSERAINPSVSKTILNTKEDLDKFVEARGLQYSFTGDLSQLLPLEATDINFDRSKPVHLENDNMVMLEIDGRITIYDSVEEISEDDARRASKAYTSLENFHKLDQKLTSQEYENIGADWTSKLLELYQATEQDPLKTSANEILDRLELEACEIL